MTRYAAFLRGVNLGGRTTRSADLVAAFGEMGFADAKTLIASGNVLFDAGEEVALAERIEAGLAQRFGFEIGVVLRRRDALRTMVAGEPFKAVPAGTDAKLYVALLREPVGNSIPLPCGIPGDFDVLATTPTDIFAIA